MLLSLTVINLWHNGYMATSTIPLISEPVQQVHLKRKDGRELQCLNSKSSSTTVGTSVTFAHFKLATATWKVKLRVQTSISETEKEVLLVTQFETHSSSNNEFFLCLQHANLVQITQLKAISSRWQEPIHHAFVSRCIVNNTARDASFIYGSTKSWERLMLL